MVHPVVLLSLSRDTIAELNKEFRGHFGIWVHEGGVIQMKTWDTSVLIVDSQIANVSRNPQSRMTVPHWLHLCEHPEDYDLIPLTGQEQNAVREVMQELAETNPAARFQSGACIDREMAIALLGNRRSCRSEN